jgi:hypothetical protein
MVSGNTAKSGISLFSQLSEPLPKPKEKKFLKSKSQGSFQYPFYHSSLHLPLHPRVHLKVSWIRIRSDLELFSLGETGSKRFVSDLDPDANFWHDNM